MVGGDHVEDYGTRLTFILVLFHVREVKLLHLLHDCEVVVFRLFHVLLPNSDGPDSGNWEVYPGDD